MAVTREQVCELYVATFNRAPDSAGLDYWSTQESLLQIELIAQSFFDQPETQAMYPSTMSNTEYVNSIYSNVYNRDADPAGLNYWVTALDNGTLQRHNTIIALVNGAQGQDQNILDNKTEVGLYFAQFGQNLTIDQAYEVMVGVGSDSTSMATALDSIDTLAKDVAIPIDPAPRMDLTTKVDTIEASDINSIITGLVDTDSGENSTLNDADTIDGGGGQDKLKLDIKGATDPYIFIANMSNVESLDINNNATTSQTIDLTGTTGITDISIIGTGTGAEISSVASIVDLELNGGADATTKLFYNADAVSSDANTMYLSLNTDFQQTFETNGIETIGVKTASGTKQLTLKDRDLQKVVVTGAGDLTLAGSGSEGSATTIDATATTGGVTIESSIVDTQDTTITTGVGNDTVTGSAIIATKSLTIETKAGDDKVDISLSAGKSVNTVVTGKGDDTIIGGAGENALTGGTGVDKMTAGSGVDTFNFANTGDTGITETDADTITGFATTKDKIDFDTLGAGTGIFLTLDADTTNTGVDAYGSFGEALAGANAAFTASSSKYYAYGADGSNGYLFLDNNLDGTADEVVIFAGLGVGGVVAGDIIA